MERHFTDLKVWQDFRKFGMAFLRAILDAARGLSKA
jgi:hypothetical protein